MDILLLQVVLHHVPLQKFLSNRKTPAKKRPPCERFTVLAKQKNSSRHSSSNHCDLSGSNLAGNTRLRV
jgi:hypothetical protein